MLDMYKQITIKTLHNQGKTNEEIAEELSCHRNTVSSVLKRDHLLESITRNKSSGLSTYHDRIKNLFEEQRLSRLRIWQILQAEEGVLCQYDTLCKYMQVHFPRNKAEQVACIVQVCQAGEVLEIDFGYVGLILGNDGQLHKTYVFVATLGYSRATFYGACCDQSIETFINLTRQAFEYFGGVVRYVKVDNLKSAVLRNTRFELTLNERFLEFCSYYQAVITPCTPYHPQQKGKVESGVGYVKGNFVAGRTFESFEHFQQELHNWMENVANVRVHGTTKKIPYEVFMTEEKKMLQPLPSTPYRLYQTIQRKVHTNCHVTLLNNYYSVPYLYVGQIVEVRLDEQLVRIVSNKGETVALHTLCAYSGTYVTNATHYPPHKISSQTAYQEHCGQKMAAIGTSAKRLFEELVADSNDWSRTVRNIIGLSTKYDPTTVDAAIERAYAYTDQPTYQLVKSICQKGLSSSEKEQPLTKDYATPATTTTTKQWIELLAKPARMAIDALRSHSTPDAPTSLTSLARDLKYYSEHSS